MHRARHLARKGKRVLITSYNVALQLCADDQLPLDMDKSELFALRIKRATELLSKKGNRSPCDAVIVDETQDVDVSRLALIRLLAGKGRDSLTLLGDMNQRIYGEPLDLEDLHISVEGRTFTLASGYRTTREIAEFGQRIVAEQGGDAPDIPRSLGAHA